MTQNIVIQTSDHCGCGKGFQTLCNSISFGDSFITLTPTYDLWNIIKYNHQQSINHND